mmetsp:Transcript_54028/g.107240  ORF Transcript_54028/g.107240 Transcript_54028/m.107240 type:complete len:442 (+) Transcript_54028:81-1406(+)
MDTHHRIRRGTSLDDEGSQASKDSQKKHPANKTKRPPRRRSNDKLSPTGVASLDTTPVYSRASPDDSPSRRRLSSDPPVNQKGLADEDWSDALDLDEQLLTKKDNLLIVGTASFGNEDDEVNIDDERYSGGGGGGSSSGGGSIDSQAFASRTSIVSAAQTPFIEGAMTNEEVAALLKLREKIAESGLRMEELHPHMRVAAESEDYYLVRFLRARKLDAAEACAMVISNHEWRVVERVDELANSTAREVLGCEVSEIWPYLPCWMQGHDKEGHPVIYKEWGNLWFNEVTVHTTTEKLVRYHIWMNEMGSRALGQQSIRLGKRVDKFTCCFNAKGFTPSHMRHGSMNFVKQITAIDQQHYPERLGIIILINAPRLISVVWSVIKRWLDPITREKVHIISLESKWQAMLEGLVETNEIPDIYGGTTPVKLPDGKPITMQKSVSP